MTIRVRFFANIREKVGHAEGVIEANGVRTARDVWDRSTTLPLVGNIRVAINHEYARMDTAVSDGDEVAFFPPVTGG